MNDMSYVRCALLVIAGWMAALSLCGADDSGKTEMPASDYVLQPSDLVRMQVFQENDMTREVRVTQEGTITLPLIATIDVKGKTVRQAEELIRQLYDKDYLVNPQITLTVLEYSQQVVQVLGSVGQAGAVAFPPEQKMGLLEAIARAGGFNRLANRKQVRLTRTSSDGKTENFVINADELIQGDSNKQWLLQKGDVIFVPERIL